MSSIEKVLIILVAIISVLAVGTTLYFVFYKGEAPNPEDQENTPVERIDPGDSQSSGAVKKAGKGRLRPTQQMPGSSAPPEAAPIQDTDEPGKIYGRVLDEDKNPIEEVRITLSAFQGSFFGFDVREEVQEETETNEQGLFQISGLSVGDNFYFQAAHRDFSVYEIRRILIQKKGTTRVPDIVLKRGGELAGIVTDKSQNPIPGARLFATSRAVPKADPFEKAATIVTSDERGYYQLQHIPPGKVVVYVAAEGYATDSKTDVPVENGQLREGVNFQLDEGLAITGTVSDIYGKPLKNARVYARPSGARIPSIGKTETDEEGRYTLPGLSDKIYQINLSLKGFAKPLRRLAKGGDTNVDFQLEPNGSIAGQVFAEDTGKPLRSFQMAHGRKYRKAKGTYFKPSESFENDEGAFFITDLDTGEYILRVKAPGYAPTESDPIQVEKGQTTERIVISLGQGSTIDGTVVDEETGKGVEGAVVRLKKERSVFIPFLQGSRKDNSDNELTGKTNKKGFFQLENSASGSFTLEISHPEYALFTQKNIIVERKEPLHLGDISLLAGGGIHGIVYTEAGSADAGAEILIQGGSIDKRIKTDRNGYYRIDRLPPNDYTVACIKRAGDVDFKKMLTIHSDENKITVLNGKMIEKNF